MRSVFCLFFIQVAIFFCFSSDLAWGQGLSCSKIHLVDEIFQSGRKALQEMLETNKFINDRGLDQYIKGFGNSFENKLNSLDSKQRWIDFGAGQNLPQIQYQAGKLSRNFGQMAETVAIAYKRPELTSYVAQEYQKVQNPERLKYLDGRYVEDIPMEEVGTYDLGTDFFGPISYTERLTDVLKIYLSGLRKDSGRLFLRLAKLTPGTEDYRILVNGVSMSNIEHIQSYETFVFTRANQKISLADWLKQLPGIEIKEVRLQSSLGPSHIVVIEIKKTSDQIRVPTLRLESINSQAPPGRIFREVENPI